MKIKDAVAHVLRGAPRLANVTNLTVISFSFLEGATKAMDDAPPVSEEVPEAWADYCFAAQGITVVRLYALLDRPKEDDRDDRMVTYQTVHKCLTRPKVLDALVRYMRNDPSQSANIENDVRHSVDQFYRTYEGIDWKLHGRLKHLRNLGIAHLSQTRQTKSITQDELRGLVLLVKRLSECLSPFHHGVPPVRGDESIARVTRATKMWRAAFRSWASIE
jgi:hypothetical protein